MADEANVRDLHEALDGFRFAMVTTTSPEGLSARPLTLLDQDGGNVRFLVSRAADWVQGLASGTEQVQVSFAEPAKSSYVALNGIASISTDRVLIEKLWNPWASAFFEGPDDPDVAVLEVAVTGGEFWDSPNGKVGRAVAMVKAMVSHDPEASGESGVVKP
jgi:general stress protein 26